MLSAQKCVKTLKRLTRQGFRIILVWLFAAILFVPSNSTAAINYIFTVQGKVVNTDGTNVTDGLYDFVFTFYDGAGSGANTLATESWTSGALFSSTMTTAPASGGESLVYSSDTNESTLSVGQTLWNITKAEPVTITSVDTATNTLGISPTRQAWATTDTITNRIYVKDGIFRVNVGTLTDLSSIDFNSGAVYVGTNFNSDGEMKPRVQLGAAPYALNAGKVNGLNVTETTGTLTIPNGQTITFSGANDLTLTTTADTNATLPAGNVTLVDTASSQTLTNKTVGSTGLSFSGASVDIQAASGEGIVIVGNAASSFETTAGGISLKPAGSSTTGVVQIGDGGAGSTTPDILALDVKSDAGDPAGANGYMYYNAASGTFRCYQAGAWGDCGVGGGGGSGLFSDGGTFIYPTNQTNDFVLGASTVADASLYFDESAGTLYLGTNEVLDGGITFYSSGTGITDPTISTNSSGDLNIDAVNGLVSLSGSSIEDVTVYVDADTKLSIEATAIPTENFVDITNAGFGVTTSSVNGLAVNYAQSTNAAAISGAGIDVTVSPSGDATDTISGLNVNAITGTSSTEYGIKVGTGFDYGLYVQTLSNYIAGLTMGGNLDLDGNSILLDSDGNSSISASNNDQIDFAINGASELTLTATALYPSTDLGLDLGTTSNYWNDLYLNGGTIHFKDTSPATFGYDSTNDQFVFDANGDSVTDAIISSNGLTLGSSVNTTTFVDVSAATTAKSQLHLTSSAGTDVSSPANGDLWWNGTNLYFYDGTNNIDLLGFEVKGNKTTVLSPQYPGAVTSPDGSSNNVDILYGMDVISNYYENYMHIEGNRNNQDMDVYIKWKVPDNFTGFQSGTNEALVIDLLTSTTDTAQSKVDVYLYKDGTTTSSSMLDNVGTAADTWYTYKQGNALIGFDETDTVLSSLSAGDILVIRLYHFVDNGDYTRTGDITIHWKSN